MIFYFHTGNLLAQESVRRVFTSAFPSGNGAAEEERERSHPLGTRDSTSCPTGLNMERDFQQLPDVGDQDPPQMVAAAWGGSELCPTAARRPKSAAPSGLSPLKRKP